MIDYNCAKLTSLLIDSEKPLCPQWTIIFCGMAAVEVRVIVNHVHAQSRS